MSENMENHDNKKTKSQLYLGQTDPAVLALHEATWTIS